MGTTTCTPVLPDSLGMAHSPYASSAVFTSSAAATASGNAVLPDGSRSKMATSGLSRSGRRENHACVSMQERLAM